MGKENGRKQLIDTWVTFNLILSAVAVMFPDILLFACHDISDMDRNDI